jgi:hypothetical protein
MSTQERIFIMSDSNQIIYSPYGKSIIDYLINPPKQQTAMTVGGDMDRVISGQQASINNGDARARIVSGQRALMNDNEQSSNQLSGFDAWKALRGYGEPSSTDLTELINMPNSTSGGLMRPKGSIGKPRPKRNRTRTAAVKPSAANRNLALAVLNDRNYDEDGNFIVPRGVKKNWSW